MRSRVRLVTTCLALSCFIAACSVGTDPGPCEDPLCYPMRAILALTVITSRTVDSVGLASYVSARFDPNATFNSWGPPVEAGEVRLNGVPLRRIDTLGAVYYERRIGEIAIRELPEYNVWNASGRRGIPVIHDSVGVRTAPMLVAPAPGDTIRGDTLVIRWTPESTSPSSDMVSIGILPTDGAASDYRFMTVYDAPGELRVPLVDSVGHRIPSGPVEMYFNRMDIIDRLAAGYFRYRMTVDRIEWTTIHLKD
jgi:hypothetical protein